MRKPQINENPSKSLQKANQIAIERLMVGFFFRAWNASFWHSQNFTSREQAPIMMA